MAPNAIACLVAVYANGFGFGMAGSGSVWAFWVAYSIMRLSTFVRAYIAIPQPSVYLLTQRIYILIFHVVRAQAKKNVPGFSFGYIICVPPACMDTMCAVPPLA